MAAKNFSRSKSFLHKRSDTSQCCTPRKSDTGLGKSKQVTIDSGGSNQNITIDASSKKKIIKIKPSRSKSLSIRSRSLKVESRTTNKEIVLTNTNTSNTSNAAATPTANGSQASKPTKVSRASRSPKKAQKSRSLTKKEKAGCESKYKSYGRTSDVIRYTRLGLPLYPDPWVLMSRHLHAATRPGDAAPSWMLAAAARLKARALAKVNCAAMSKTQEVNKQRRSGSASMTDSDASLTKQIGGSKNDLTSSTAASLRKMALDLKKNCVIGDGEDENDEDDDDANEEDDEDDSDDVPTTKDADGAALIEYGDDDDEEEEEGGVPQAVRALNASSSQQSCGHVSSAPLSTREILRERQRACMEEVARQVAPGQLLAHLRLRGFLQADYSKHTRANSSNSSLRAGKKRPIEKLMGVVGNGRITQTFTATHH